MIKLTLSVPERILKQARTYAKTHQTSISSIVSSIFDSLQKTGNKENQSFAPLTQSLVGILTPPTGTRKADLISEALMTKFSNKK